MANTAKKTKQTASRAAAKMAEADGAPPVAGAPGVLVLVVAASDSFVLGHQKMSATYMVMAPGVLKNDYPESGLTAEPSNPPASAGTVQLSSTGGFSFTPPNPQFTGPVTFEYRARQMMSASEYVRVTLRIVNHPPEAAPDCYLFVRGMASYMVTAQKGVLNNDYDPQGVVPQGVMLSAVLSSNGSHGIVNLNFDGSFGYTPSDPADPQDDTFTYTAKDSADVHSPETTVTLKFITP